MARPPTLPSWGTTGGTRVEPSGSKKAAGFTVSEKPPARFFNWLFGVSSDWIVWFDGLLNGTQPFTGDRLEFAGTDADEPLLWTTKSATEDPADAGNDWKLLFGFKVDSTRYCNVYVGKGSGSAGEFAITVNGIWDRAAQQWHADAAGKPSIAILWESGSIRVTGQPAGHAAWATWPAAPTGVGLVVNGTLGVEKATQFFDDVTIPTADLIVGGGASANTLDIAIDATVGGDVLSGGNFRYSTPPARDKIVPMASGAGGSGAGFVDDVSGGRAYWVLDPGEVVSFPIEVPSLATSISMVVKMLSSAGTTYKIDAQRGTFNFAAASLPSYSNVDSDTGTAGAGAVVNIASNFTAITANSVETYHIRIENTGGANQLQVHGVEKLFTDPGPKNI